MRLRDVFVAELRKRGVERVATRMRKVMSSKDPIAKMALYVANGKAEVCKSSCGLRSSITLEGDFVNLPPDAYVGNCSYGVILRGEDLTCYPFPYLLVDCRFYDEHSEKEKQKLALQLRQTLGVVRQYMWDKKLVVTYRNFGFGVFSQTTENFLIEKGIKKVVLLDPNGDELYARTGAECLIIGGIVDKSGLKSGYTTKIGREIEKEGIDVDYRKIELRGDVVGVPDRINHIAEIVLRVELDGEDVEKAVREVQPPIVAKWRLRKELHERTIRVCISDKTFRVVLKKEFENFREWLNIRKRDFYEVCEEQKFFIVSDELMDKIRKLEWDEKRKCYKLNTPDFSV